MSNFRTGITYILIVALFNLSLPADAIAFSLKAPIDKVKEIQKEVEEKNKIEAPSVEETHVDTTTPETPTTTPPTTLPEVCTSETDQSATCLEAKGADYYIQREFSSLNGNDDMWLASIISTIMALWTAVNGGFYLAGCYTRVSAWTYALSALAGIISEIVFYADFKTQSEEAFNVFQTEDYQEQIAGLKAAEAEARAAANNANQKFWTNFGISMGYVAAGIIALIEAAVEWESPTQGACTGSVNQTNQKHYAYSDLFPQTFKDGTDHTLQNINAMNDMFSSDLTTLAKNIEASPNDLTTYFLMQEHLATDKKSPTTTSYEKALVSNILNGNQLKAMILPSLKMVSNTIIPEANAVSTEDVMKDIGIGLGHGLVATLIIGITAAATTNNMAFSAEAKTSGWARAIIFAANAALVLSSLIHYDSAEDSFNASADQYTEVIRDLERLESPTYGDMNSANNSKLSGNNAPAPVPTTPPAGSPQNCNTGTDLQYQQDQNCECLKTNSCTSITPPDLTSFNFDSGNPISGTLKGLTDMTNSLNQGNSQGAVASGQQVAQNAAGLFKARKKAEDDINNMIKAEGKDALDFKKLKEDAMKNQINGFQQGYAALSASDKAGINEMFGLPKDADIVTGKTADGKPIAKSSNKFAVPTIKPNKDGKGYKLDFNFDDKPKVLTMAKVDAPKEVKKAGYIDDKTYDGNEDGSIAGRSENLFDLITRRYKESAYPNFFELKK